MIVSDNYLLLTDIRKFSQKHLNYFSDRLGIFLSKGLNSYPKLILSDTIEDSSIACFDDSTNEIWFDINCFNKDSKLFIGNTDKILLEISDYDIDDFQYIIPLSYIYHELIHAYQFSFTPYLYTPLLEGSNEIFTYCITGQQNIDYIKEAIGFWNIGYNIMNIKNPAKFYQFIRDSIVSSNFDSILYSNKLMLKELSENFNHSIEKFYNNFHKVYGDLRKKTTFLKTLNSIHELIFYNW